MSRNRTLHGFLRYDIANLGGFDRGAMVLAGTVVALHLAEKEQFKGEAHGIGVGRTQGSSPNGRNP